MEKLFFNNAIVRTPLYPVNFYREFIKDSRKGMEQLLADKTFLNAVYLASPQLYYLLADTNPAELFEDSKKAKKLRLSIMRYAYRISTRCTPFGLFAGCSVAEIADRSNLLLEDSRHFKQHTRLDMQYLFSLASRISELPFVRPYLKYTINTSLYPLGLHYRYVECQYVNSRRKFELVSVDANEYVKKIVDFVSAADGVSANDIAAILTDDDISAADAAAFVEELIGAQVLVSSLELGTTGDEMGVQLVGRLERILANGVNNKAHADAIAGVLGYLKDIQSSLGAIDSADADQKMSRYQQLKAKAEAFQHPFDEQTLIQTDMITGFKAGLINKDILADVQKGVDIVCRFSSKKGNSKLEKFRQAFEYRYESKMVPLVEALDIEAGIGYGNHMEEDRSDISEFMSDILFSPTGESKQDVTLDSKTSSFWIAKITEALTNQTGCIEITDEDLKQFPAKSDTITTTNSASAALYKGRDNGHILFFQGVAGPTGATWLGRFGGMDAPTGKLVKELIDAEESEFSGKIVAEITHLPEARLGNVLQRPAFRRYEIPYMASSGVAKEFQVPITDLMLCSRGGRMVLVSKKHNKEVQPYLTNAHYYGNGRSLPLYHFLCDMQELNGQDGCTLDVKVMQQFFNYIPRIRYKNIILRRASWKFSQEDIASLMGVGGETLKERFNEFARRHHLADLFCISHSDNELVIDKNSVESLEVFINEVKGQRSFTLSEVLFNEFEPLVKDGDGGSYNNEVIFFFKRGARPVIANAPVRKLPVTDNEMTRRDFLPGSEWAYFNLYSGFKNADRILLELQPVIEDLRKQKIIDKWFFIRYQDPKLHLRLRVHLTDTLLRERLYGQLYPAIELLKEQQLIWRATVDTYRRELERYGVKTIEPVETIFLYDSMMCVDLIRSFDDAGEDSLKWLAGLYSAGTYLDLFGLSLEEKLHFTESLSTQFAAEFRSSDMALRSIDKKYRASKSRIAAVMERRPGNEQEAHLIAIVDRRNERILKMIGGLEGGGLNVKTAFADSLIHMSVNRLFRSRQRAYEYVIYSFLKKTYASALARKTVASMPVVG